MAIVIKTIRRRQYRYSQHSTRVGGKVKTTSVYLGPVNPKRASAEGFFRTVFVRRHGLPDDEKMLAEYNAKVARDVEKFNAALDNLHTEFGLKMPAQSPTPLVEVAKAPQEVAPAVNHSEPAPATGDQDSSAPAENEEVTSEDER